MSVEEKVLNKAIDEGRINLWFSDGYLHFITSVSNVYMIPIDQATLHEIYKNHIDGFKRKNKEETIKEIIEKLKTLL